ncbi:MAG: molybdenum cofactor guanylyltransferase [Terrisporobacter sp.]|uniref:molybdenum cofactor guanylyltransferase n=1 Tax=Terrisporobacter sp. TaxID=1965305 RepID=UPI002FCC77E1
MGGKNTRMSGIIKGLLNIGKETFLEKIINNIGYFPNIYLSVNKDFTPENIKKYEQSGLDIVVDLYDGIGPVGGIYSSLKKCKEDYLFVTTCDMPFINKEFVEYLSSFLDDSVDIVLCHNEDKRLYPLGAIYSKRVIPTIEEMVDEKCYKLTRLIYDSNYIEIPIDETPFSSEIFTNINTPEEYNLFLEKHSKII